MSSLETKMYALKMTTPQLKEAARCEYCDQHTYLECKHCYCVLNYEGQIHNCPVKEKILFNENGKNLDICESFSRVKAPNIIIFTYICDYFTLDL